ncbi:MAG: hypothetical protein ACTSRK_00185 [Promethearchaeota archaeon]
MTEEIKNEEKIIIDVKEERFKKRLRWIDQARGFIMLYLVATVAIDVDFPSGSIAEFFLAHAGREANYMTLFDAGTVGFIFIIGVSMAIAFTKRRERDGLKKTLFHILIRFSGLAVVGLIIVLADNGGEIMQDREVGGIIYTVVRWDVVIGIALAYILTVPFLFIKNPKIRFLVALGWSLLYQVLLYTTTLRAYAQASSHGGIFGTIFGLTAVSVIASAIGEYLFRDPAPEDKKYANVFYLGIIMLVSCFLLAYIPGMEAAKRQVSFTYVGISVGVTIIGISLFAYLDRKKDMEMAYLRGFGLNPFFIYFIAEIPVFLFDEIVGVDLGFETYPIIGNLIVTAVLLLYTSIISIRMYKMRKMLSTEKMSFIGAITLIILAAILLGTGIL